MTTQIDPRTDHYKILGVKEDAESEEIKKAYRRLAKQYHPDRTGGDKAKEARFKEIGQAYDILGDPAKRRQYDAMRSGAAFGGFPGGAGGFPGGMRGGFSADGLDGLGDLFSQMFSGGASQQNPGGVHFRFSRGGRPSRAGRARPPAPKPPTERKVRLSDGTNATLRGNHVYSDLRLSLDQAILGTITNIATLESSAKVKIPPGTSSGVKLRLKGKGAHGSGNSRGNHYVTVPHRRTEESRRESKEAADPAHATAREDHIGCPYISRIPSPVSTPCSLPVVLCCYRGWSPPPCK